MNIEDTKKLNLGDIVVLEIEKSWSWCRPEVVGYVYALDADGIVLSKYNPKKSNPHIFNFYRSYSFEDIISYKILEKKI